MRTAEAVAGDGYDPWPGTDAGACTCSAADEASPGVILLCDHLKPIKFIDALCIN
jgi:hypothetical protein